MSRCKTNKEAWQLLFDKYDILEKINQNGFFKITAKEINEYREARLMTKFDNSANLPEILKKNNLSILPITSNSYMMARFQTYRNFDKTEDEEITKINFPKYIESLDYNNITSEALAINCAYLTKILEDFLDEKKLVPTISGKMGSGKFKFKINSNQKENEAIDVSVENSRIEIDGGYEGLNNLALIEAKNVISEDFIIRQLYYPYRLWKNKINKPIRLIYIVYSNNIFNLYEYKFEEEDNYNSIKFVKNKRYCIENIKIRKQDIYSIFHHIKQFVKEPKVPFPQANSFDRVINLCELLLNKPQTKNEITEKYAFNKRQTNYYTDAGRYLGLIEKRRKNKNIIFSLTQLGKDILKLPYKQRQLELVKLILSHKVFYESYKLYSKEKKKPEINNIVEIMKISDLYNIRSKKTYERRSSTITGWIDWILKLIEK